MTIICINCPIGCRMDVEVEGQTVISVKGNNCARGKSYAQVECVNPTRTLTSTVRLVDGPMEALSVKTSRPVPKTKLRQCIRELKGVEVKPPVKIGDVIARNIAGTGIDMVSTKDIP
ncbi:MAG: DUF1667 domain-containing protein [Clostridiales bacterium]|jgi:CxxC motif-containing protein|nr:DUF1667 domain-containing protein [Clostridiales bacterium]